MPHSLSKIVPAALFFLLCFFASPARTHADTIAFTTTGGFFVNDLGARSNSITYGSGANTVTLTFVGASASLSNPTSPTNGNGSFLTNFGQIQVTVTGNGATITPSSFFIQGTQSSPNSATFGWTAYIEGTITPDSSTARLGFNRGTESVTPLLVGPYDKLVYTIDFLNSGFVNLAPPNVNGGATNITGRVGAVPEPATLVLLGTGIAGLATRGVRRRRRQ